MSSFFRWFGGGKRAHMNGDAMEVDLSEDCGEERKRRRTRLEEECTEEELVQRQQLLARQLAYIRKRESEKLERSLDEVRKSEEGMRDQLMAVKNKNSEVEKQNEKFKKENEEMRAIREQELKKQRELSTVQVQVCYSAQDVYGADKNFLDLVQAHLLKQKVNLVMEEWCIEKPTPNNKPVIVVCLNSSRLVTDVQNAMDRARTKGIAKTLLVVMHHSPPHMRAPTSSKTLVSVGLREGYGIEEVVDCVFWRGNAGLYSCDSNDQARDAIAYSLRQQLVARTM